MTCFPFYVNPVSLQAFEGVMQLGEHVQFTLLFPAGDCRPGRVWAVSGGGSYLFFLVSFNRGYGEGRGKVLPVLGGEGDTIFSGLGKKSLHASNRHSDHFSVAE